MIKLFNLRFCWLNEYWLHLQVNVELTVLLLVFTFEKSETKQLKAAAQFDLVTQFIDIELKPKFQIGLSSTSAHTDW